MNRKILSSNGYDFFEQGDTAQELADKTLSAFFGRKVEVSDLPINPYSIMVSAGAYYVLLDLDNVEGYFLPPTDEERFSKIALRLKAHSENANTAGFTGGQLKFNSVNQGGTYTNYGNTLPALYTGGYPNFNGNVYYVMKKPSTATTSSPTYVAFYDPSGYLGQYDSATLHSGSILYTSSTNSTNVSVSSAAVSQYRFYQVLCTPTKSW